MGRSEWEGERRGSAVPIQVGFICVVIWKGTERRLPGTDAAGIRVRGLGFKGAVRSDGVPVGAEARPRATSRSEAGGSGEEGRGGRFGGGRVGVGKQESPSPAR